MIKLSTEDQLFINSVHDIADEMVKEAIIGYRAGYIEGEEFGRHEGLRKKTSFKRSDPIAGTIFGIIDPVGTAVGRVMGRRAGKAEVSKAGRKKRNRK